MTLVVIFQDGNGAATGSGTAGPAASTFVPAVHRKVGVRQAGVPSHGGGAGLAMRAREVMAWLTTPHSAPQ